MERTTDYAREDFRRPPAPSRALPVTIAVVALLAAAGGIALYVWQERHPPTLPEAPRAEAPPAPAAPVGPVHPVTTDPAARKLPALGASDDEMRAELARELGPGIVERLVFEDFVRHVVASIDNLPREQVATRLNPLRATAGVPRVERRGNEIILAPANDARYAAGVAAVESVDAAKLGALYRRWYPLFQQAYEELGYPTGYFNDRLVEAIDDLLAAPEVKGPIRLVQPKVLYEFADPALEERSAGQKMMIRIGAANEARVKAKLREIRAQVATGKPG